MTPQEALDIHNASETIRRITAKNNGCLLMLASNPEKGVLPNFSAKLNMQGERNVLIENLKLASEQNPQLATVIRSTAQHIDITNYAGKSPQPHTDKESEILGHIDQMLDMQENYPEIAQNLQVFVNHFKGLITCLKTKVA